MKKHYPIIILVALLVLVVGIQSFLARGTKEDSPEHYQSQVGKAGTSLDKVKSFELEIELKDDGDTTMHYMQTEDESPQAIVKRSGEAEKKGDEAVQEIRNLLGSVSPLPANQPLTLVQEVLDQLGIHQKDLKEFEFEYELEDGTNGNIELEVDNLSLRQRKAEITDNNKPEQPDTGAGLEKDIEKDTGMERDR